MVHIKKIFKKKKKIDTRKLKAETKTSRRHGTQELVELT